MDTLALRQQDKLVSDNALSIPIMGQRDLERGDTTVRIVKGSPHCVRVHIGAQWDPASWGDSRAIARSCSPAGLDKTAPVRSCSILSSQLAAPILSRNPDNHASSTPASSPRYPARRNLMASQRDKLREDVRFRVLRLLQDGPEMSQRDLAAAVGVSTGGIHYVLNALLDKGLIKIGNFSATTDKRRYAYLLTRKGIATKTALTRRFLLRKIAEYEAIRAEIEDAYAMLEDHERAEITAQVEKPRL